MKAAELERDTHKVLLIMAGQALYGDRWQTDLARDLGLSDGRRIRQWLSGDRPIPKGIWNDVAKLLAERQSVINHALSATKALVLEAPKSTAAIASPNQKTAASMKD